MSDITFADISKWQDDIDAPAYLAGGHSVLIVRTYGQDGPDDKMPGRQSYLRGYDFDAIGYYQRLSPTLDPAQQAPTTSPNRQSA